MIRTATLLALALTACAVEPSTSTTEQFYCTIDNQAAGTCPGQEGCVPLDSCVDANLIDGSCCIQYGHPATPIDQGATCGNTAAGTPYCQKKSTWFAGTFFQTTCSTVTYWIKAADGTVTTLVYTDCYRS